MLLDNGWLMNRVETKAHGDSGPSVPRIVLALPRDSIRTPDSKGGSKPYATNQLLGKVRWRRISDSFLGCSLQGTPTLKVPSKDCLGLTLDFFLAEIMCCFQAAEHRKQGGFLAGNTVLPCRQHQRRPVESASLIQALSLCFK